MQEAEKEPLHFESQSLDSYDSYLRYFLLESPLLRLNRCDGMAGLRLPEETKGMDKRDRCVRHAAAAALV